MWTAAECLGKAEECELRAAELSDPEQRREWLRMASEWRVAAARTLTVPPDDSSSDPL